MPKLQILVEEHKDGTSIRALFDDIDIEATMLGKITYGKLQTAFRSLAHLVSEE